MKSVLISIQPKYCELIANGEKTIEVRKSRPKLGTPFKCYIYETQGQTETPWVDEDGHLIFKGRGQVIGEFVCDNVYEWECRNRLELVGEFGLPNWRASYMCFVDDLEKTCLTYEDLWDYGKGKTLYGWHISDLVIYDKPKELEEFRAVCKYRNDDGSCRYKEVECDCVKFDFNQDWSVNYVECLNFMSRPPQSWCYVEE